MKIFITYEEEMNMCASRCDALRKIKKVEYAVCHLRLHNLITTKQGSGERDVFSKILVS